MKLTQIKVQNFRRYRDEITLAVDDLTILIGKNDAGKSTLLDALDIFFNDAPIEKDDAHARGDAADVRITCVFSDLPAQIVLDAQHPTTLPQEYLVRQDGQLEICRVFNCSSAKGKPSRVFARACHPSAENCDDLLRLRIAELKSRARTLGTNLTDVNETIKTDIRQAIWSQHGALALAPCEVDLGTETAKTAWEQIQAHLPVFALFKSDRASTDQDGEAQDPMKAAIKEAVRGYETQLDGLVAKVKTELERVAKKTVEKIQEMSPELARSLDPQVKNKNWDSLFSVSLTGDDGISINKRGSGTRRLVLVNFFRAKAEDAASARSTGVIYAVEEPETSQHPNHQLLLLDAFQELTAQGKAQVILTTHTPTLARKVNRSSLRFVTLQNGRPAILPGADDATLALIKAALGVLPDHDVRIFVGVEGKWDIEFLKRISKVLHTSDPTVPDLGAAELSGKLVFIPLGGSSMELWTCRMAGLNRPEYYITDRDEAPPARPKYHEFLVQWNSRGAECVGVCTTKRELENYIHPDAIRAVIPGSPAMIADFDDVPALAAEALHRADPAAPDWGMVTTEKRKEKASRVKRRLNTECADLMTAAHLSVTDPALEITGWLRAIGSRL